MKKLATLLTMLMLTSSAMAVYIEGKTTDPELLRKTGNSESAIRLIEDVKVRNSGYDGEPYESFYQDTSYNGDFSSNKKEFILSWYRKVRDQIDPAQDDGYFGKHQVNYNNRFFMMMPNQNIFDKTNEDL